MKVKIFWYFEVLNFRSDDVTFLRNIRNGHFEGRAKKKENIIRCDCEKNGNSDKETTTNHGVNRERSELQL